jgi:hypothetical protein
MMGEGKSLKPRIELLSERLESIAQGLREAGGLGLLGLGSAGAERGRLDEWSDLDFFAVVSAGEKARFLAELSWLEAAVPIAYRFRNTADGYKLLYADGVFAEMAVFEPPELEAASYAPGSWVWRDPSLDETLSTPRRPGYPPPISRSPEWCSGELATCLYIGLCHYRRGERLSAWRFVQSHCVDRYLELVELEEGRPPAADPYCVDRRFERLHPEAAAPLPRFIAGYDRTPEAALAMLEWLESRALVHAALAAEIRRLARAPTR